VRKSASLAAITAGLILAIAGCSDESGGGSPNGSGNGVDRAFAAAMILHHESAVEMAEIAQERGESRFVKQLADDIVGTQNIEIDTLRAQDAELEQAGIEVGELGMDHDMMGMDEDPSVLRAAEPFDRTFIDLMIPHHEGAIAMAEVELDKGADPELRALAEQIIDAQEREIAVMKEHISGVPEHDGH
jgi:uncharacterized protein (DUF305 family)